MHFNAIRSFSYRYNCTLCTILVIIIIVITAPKNRLCFTYVRLFHRTSVFIDFVGKCRFSAFGQRARFIQGSPAHDAFHWQVGRLLNRTGLQSGGLRSMMMTIVYLSARLLEILTDFKIFWRDGASRGKRTKCLDFRGDPDHDMNPDIFRE